MINFQVTKASGESEDFSEEKLLNSLKRAGVQEDIGKKALQLVKKNLSSNINTDKVHNLVLQYLHQQASPLHHLNYNLKRALFKLGPTGHPFEHLIAKMLQQYGYQTRIGVILKGRCVNHEIDIVAKKQNQVFYIECKFHNRPGLKTDVQVALYTKARFNDLIENIGDKSDHSFYSWLVTNTQVTSDAINYTKCQNIKITSWGYPANESLFNLIIASKLHPITALTALSPNQTKILIEQNTVTVKDLVKLLKNNQITNLLPQTTIKKIKKEIEAIRQ